MAGKVGCGLLLAVLFCAAAVSRAPFVVFLLALAMVFTAFLWWDARTLRRQVTALQLPAKPVRPGEAFAVTVHLQNAGRRTVPELRAVLRAEDAESGTAIELPCAAMLAPGGRADLRVTLRAAKSGLWRFKLQKLTVRDHLGLFAADCPPDGQTWELCVLPPAEGEADSAGNAPQNRAEQESRAGQDIADGVYDLRPYRVGDPLKQIHWKLTAKVDELTVREPLGTTYRADPAGTLLAEDGGTPPPVLHFGRAAVTRLRTLTRRKAADPDTGLEFVDRVLLPQQGAAARPVLRGFLDTFAADAGAAGGGEQRVFAGAARLDLARRGGAVRLVAGAVLCAAACRRQARGCAGAGRGVSGAAVFGAAGLPARHRCLCQRREAMPEYTFQRGFCCG